VLAQALRRSLERATTGVMATDRPAPPSADEPTPMRFVIVEHEDGQRTLDVREPEFEQVYRVVDAYSAALFVALCRHEGVRAYRRRRQHEGTLCIRTTPSQHNALWARFLELSRQLDARIGEVTERFLREAFERKE
jgi:hypothetical protein